ncbi:MAG: pyridoxal phosphate-dependent aminotransferase [Pseudomonadota bacterium]
MSVAVSSRMARVRPSATAMLLARAKALQAEGEHVVSLAAGEPDFDTPESIKQAARHAIDIGDTKYTALDGTAELKNAIVKKFRRENHLDYAPEQIVVSNGAKQCLFSACLGLLEAGDEAVVPAPYWVSYPDMVRLAGADPVIVSTSLDTGFKMTPEQLDDAMSERTRIVFLNSPCNPTGSAYTRDELVGLGAVIANYPRATVLSDEIYEHIYWASSPCTSFAAACPDLHNRTLTVNGVSKAYAMTGWRIGYVAGPDDAIKAIRTVQSQCTSNAGSISQAAAVEALNGDQTPVRDMCAAYRERHDYVVAELNALDGVECRPGEGTFYAFPRINGVLERLGFESDADFAEMLIDEVRLVTVPGSAFGAPGYLRLSFASSMDELTEALSRLKKAIVA